MGTNYSVSITAFNCINQEGEVAAYDIQPQLLGMMHGTAHVVPSPLPCKGVDNIFWFWGGGGAQA